MGENTTTQQKKKPEDPRIKEAEEISKEFNLKLEDIYLKFMDKLENIKKTYINDKKVDSKEYKI